MSLAEKSDGILETHVHWEEIEKEMQKALETTATFGPEKTVQNIGEGNGFLSRICLIRPDWQNGSEDLPKAFIAKICTPITMMDFSEKSEKEFDISALIDRFVLLCTSVHNMEVDTYNIMHKYSEGRIPLPKIYGSRRFSDDNKVKGFLLMEYFDDLVPCHLSDNITVEAMKKVIRSIAIWQGIGMKMTEEEKSIYSTTFLGDNFGDMFKPEMMEQLKDGLEEFGGPEHVETARKFHGLMLKLCTKEVYGKYDALPDRLGYKRVFSHGDVWSTNILWTRVDGVFDIRAHIDFQTSSFNSPVVDLVRAFSACLSGEDRRNHHKELLSIFYDYLREEIEGELPYTLKQLEESYDLIVPLGAFLVVPIIPHLYDYMVKARPELAGDSKQILQEKAVALMEDALASDHLD